MEIPKLDLLNQQPREAHINYAYFKGQDEWEVPVANVKVSNLFLFTHFVHIKKTVITLFFTSLSNPY